MSIRFLSQKKSAELIIRRLETELNQRQQQQKQQVNQCPSFLHALSAPLLPRLSSKTPSSPPLPFLKSISCVSLSSDEGDDDSLVLFASTYDGGGVSTLLVTREDSLVLLPPFVPPLVSCASIPDSKLHFMLDSAGNVFYLTGPLKKGAASTPTPTNPTTTTSAIVGTHQLQYQQLAFSEKSKPLPDHEFSSSVKIKSMSCGMGHSLFLSTDGRLFGFGDNDNGQLGDDSIPSSSSASSPSNSRLVARLITSLFGTPISKICCGGKHSLILTSFGSVYSFGNNAFGQLGVGDRVQRNSPSRISILNDRKIVDISCGEEHSVILTSTGTVFTCGAGTERERYDIFLPKCGTSHTTAI